MVVKEYLENQGVDLKRFQQLRRSKPLPRRRLSRMVGGDITVPVPITNIEIKETLKVKLDTCMCFNSQKIKLYQCSQIFFCNYKGW